jgi:hypothetical protein
MVRGSTRLDATQLAERLHNRIKGSGFNKTDFALALLAQDPSTWTVPHYILDGLQWLEGEITPLTPSPTAQPDAGTRA